MENKQMERVEQETIKMEKMIKCSSKSEVIGSFRYGYGGFLVWNRTHASC